MKTRRLLGTLAAVAVGATLVPVSLPGAAGAAASCVAPQGLTPDQGYRSSSPSLKNIVLSWQPVAGATGYTVQAGLDEDFASNVLLTTDTVGTKFAIATGTLNDTTFFWHVKVKGAACWSDDGATNAATVTKGWDDSPAPVPGTGPDTGFCAAGSIPLSQVRFCWKPVTHASYYEVVVADASTGTEVGRCFTNQTQLTPNALVTNADNATERLTNQRCISTTDIREGGNYTWRVYAIDQSGLKIDGSPYGDLTSGFSAARPKDHLPDGSVTVTGVSPRYGSTSGGYLVSLVGSGFSAAKTAVTFAGTTIDVDHVSVDDSTHLHFVAPTTLTAGTSDVSVNVTDLSGGNSSTSSPYDLFTAYSPSGSDDIDHFLNAEVSSGSPVTAFSVSTTAHTGTLVAPAGVTVTAPDATGALSINCAALDASTANDCATTPVIRWTPVPAATEYRVYIWADTKLSHLLRTYETHSASLAVHDLLLPNQAGKSYEASVQSCTDSGCGPVAVAAAFRIRSKPVVVTDPSQGASTSDSNITLSWSDYLATNGSALENGQYLVQVAKDCAFSDIADSAQVDIPQYTSPTLVYAAGTYYWRVAAIDASGSQLAWGPAPNRDASTASGACGDARRFTIDRTDGATNGGGVVKPTATPLAIHFGTPVAGLSAANVHLVETSTGRIVPTVFTALPDGASLLPQQKDLVAGDYYVVTVTGSVTDSSGNVVQPLTQSPFRAPTRLDAPGLYVKLGGKWQTRKAAGSYGGTAVVTTSKKRPSANLRFRGTAVSIGYCKGPQNGYLAVYLDGKLKRTFSTYASFTTCGKPGVSKAPHYVIGKLDGTKQHFLTVVETGKKGHRKGINAALDYVDIS